jgi:alkylation response protein AidB-like acyl-CoA dehydrogenase
MDLTPSPFQQQILDAVQGLCKRVAGHERAMRLLPDNAYDHDLARALGDGGFLEVALGEETDPLEASMVAHEVALAAGMVSVGASVLVAPMVLGETLEGPVALATDPSKPLRWGPHARTVLIDGGDEALRVDASAGDWDSVDNDHAGYPLGRLKSGVAERARGVGKGSGERLRNWWRVALAAETAGTMKGAVDTTVRYVGERVQFDRPIGSFQSVQHRLAILTIYTEGSRWLAYQAAFDGAPADAAASAAAYATGWAIQTFRETQQLHGAIGFTREYRLHIWSMRLPALAVEMGGPVAHRLAVASSRFQPDSVRQAIESYRLG